MGKSKRIRSDRALDNVNNPTLKSQNEKKKANRASAIIISIIAVILVLTTLLVVLNSCGIVRRLQTTYSSEHYKVDGAMLTYMYESLCTTYFYNYWNAWASYGLDPSNYYSMLLNSARTQAKSDIATQVKLILQTCEAARAEGMELTEVNKQRIEKAIENIKTTASENNKTVSALYGNKGVTVSDIRRALELQYLANQYSLVHEDELRNAITDEDIQKYLSEHMSEIYKGDYIQAVTDDEELRALLTAAKSVDEFLKIYTEKYVKDHLVTDAGTATAVPSASLLEALKKVLADELKYSLLKTEVEGVTFDEDDARADRLETIFDKKYKDTVTSDKIGLTVPTDSMYEKIAKADVSSLSASSTAEEIEAKAAEVIDGLYKTETEALPTVEELNKFISTLVSDLLYTMFEKEIEGVTFTEDEDEKTVERIKKIYKAIDATDAEAVKDALYDVVASISDTMKKNLGSDLVKVSYPIEATDDDEDEDDDDHDHDHEDEDSSSASSSQVALNNWFFEDGRAEGDIYSENEDNVYIVMTPKYLDEAATKNVAHLLVQVSTTTASSTATDEEKAEIEAENNNLFAEALKKAQEYLDEYNAGDKTLQSFKDLAYLNTDDSGVVYYNVEKDQMVEEFNDWIFDEARQVGDVEIVKTEYGQHLMYFVGEGLPAWKATVVDALLSERYEALEDANAEKYTVTENATAISAIVD